MSSRRLLIFGLLLGATGLSSSGTAPAIELGAPEIMKMDWGTRALRIVDMNNDGLQDVVTINHNRAAIEILYQLAPGEEKPARVKIETNRWEPEWEDARFRLKREIIGEPMMDLLVEDLDGDGHMDLVYTGEVDPLTIRWGRGADEAKVEKPALLPPARGYGETLRSADVNGDSRNDLVILLRDGIAILEATKDAGFGSVRMLQLAEGSTSNLHLTDISGDGRLDLFYIRSDDENTPVRIRLQKPSGKFGPELTLPLEGVHWSLSSVDAVPGFPSDETHNPTRFLTTELDEGAVSLVEISLRTGSDHEFQWEHPQVMTFNQTGRSGAAYALEDFDGDGQRDIVASDPEGTEMIVFLRESDGGFGSANRYPTYTGVSQLTAIRTGTSAQAGLVLLSESEGVVGLATITDNGRLTYPQPLEFEGEPIAMASAGLPQQAQDSIFLLYRHDKKRWLGSFSVVDATLELRQKIELTGLRSDPTAVVNWDADRDGQADALVFLPREPARLYLASNSGEFEQLELPVGYQENLLKDIAVTEVSQIDVDGDGNSELNIVSDQFVRAVRLNDAGRLEVVEQFNSHAPAAGIGAMIKIDGKDDAASQVVLYDRKQATFEIQSPDVQGVFRTVKSHPVGRIAVSAVHAGSRNDVHGQIDEVFLLGREQFWWFPRGAPNPEIQKTKIFTTELPDTNFLGFVIGDLNNDGVDDLVNFDANQSLIEIASFDGEFESVMHFRVFESSPRSQNATMGRREPREARLGDVTGDGLQDLVQIVHDRILIYPQLAP